MDIDFCISVVSAHLQELGMNIGCDIEFFPTETKRSFLSENIAGMYVPAENTAYIRVSSIPRMVSTIAHEVAHDYLMKNSKVGRELISKDIMIRTLETGEIDVIVHSKEYRALYTVSRFVNEGFATYVGFYVLKRFADVVSNDISAKEHITKNDLIFLQNVLKDLAELYDGRQFDYYYGKMEFDRIESLFGLRCVKTAAIEAMNVEYDVDPEELIKYHEKIRKMVYSREDLSIPNLNFPLECYLTIPNFRIIAFSRILPNYVDAIFDASEEYFTALIERVFGDFRHPVVSRLRYPVTKRGLGYLLGRYRKSRDPRIFYDYLIPDEIMARLKYELNVDELIKSDRGIYEGFLLYELENATVHRAREILEQLAYMGVVDQAKALKLASYSSKIEIEKLVDELVNLTK